MGVPGHSIEGRSAYPGEEIHEQVKVIKEEVVELCRLIEGLFDLIDEKYGGNEDD